MLLDRLPPSFAERRSQPCRLLQKVEPRRDDAGPAKDPATLQSRPLTRGQQFAALPPRMPLPRLAVPRQGSKPHAPPDPGVEDLHEFDRTVARATLMHHLFGMVSDLELDLSLRADPLAFHVMCRLARDRRGASRTLPRLLAARLRPWP
jgi:hypothetical protein